MKSSLGKVVSVIFLVLGILMLLTVLGVDFGFGGLLGLAAGNFIAGVGVVGLATVSTLVAGIVYLLAGIFGLAGKRGITRIIAWIILIVSVIALIISIINKGFEWADLVGLVLPVLYFLAK